MVKKGGRKRVTNHSHLLCFPLLVQTLLCPSRFYTWTFQSDLAPHRHILTSLLPGLLIILLPPNSSDPHGSDPVPPSPALFPLLVLDLRGENEELASHPASHSAVSHQSITQINPKTQEIRGGSERWGKSKRTGGSKRNELTLRPRRRGSRRRRRR